VARSSQRWARGGARDLRLNEVGKEHWQALGAKWKTLVTATSTTSTATNRFYPTCAAKGVSAPRAMSILEMQRRGERLDERC
jgi:hypothetical protein